MCEEKYIENKRIWELDFLRGIAIFIMIFIHIPYVIDMFTDIEISWNPIVFFLRKYGGAFFIIISGVCAGFSSTHYKRGLNLLAVAIFITCITVILYKFDVEDTNILIEFGILHLIAFSMLVYPIFKKMPTIVLLILSIGIIVFGYYLLMEVRFPKSILLIFGFKPVGYYVFDYFPILPNFGWYLIGIVIYRLVYEKNKRTIIPVRNYRNIFIRFFTFLGRNSIYFYLIHLPLIYLLVKLIF